MSKVRLTAEPGALDFTIEREFDAARERVFKAHIDAQAIPQWWGPSWLTTEVDQMDPRKGGVWRFVQRDGKGGEFAFTGVFHEVNAPERIIQTWEFEGFPGKVLLETITFEELPGGRTMFRSQSVFQDVADRDGLLQASEGGHEMWDRLDDLLAKGSDGSGN